jgi:hypothetical protein
VTKYPQKYFRHTLYRPVNIFGLFNDAFNGSDCIAPIDRLMSEGRIRKDVDKRGSVLIYSIVLHFPGRGIHKMISVNTETILIRTQLPRCVNAMFPKLCSADPKGSINNTQGIRGFISIMAALNFTYFLKRNNILLKIIEKLL